MAAARASLQQYAIRLLGMLLIFIALPISILAQDSGIQVSVNVNKKRLTLQDTITLTIILKGAHVEHINLQDDSGGIFPRSFILLNKSEKISLIQDAFGRPIRARTLQYQLQPTAAGRFTLGALVGSRAGQPYNSPGERVEVVGSSGQTTRIHDNPPESILPTSTKTLDLRLSVEVDHSRVYVGERITFSTRITHNSANVEEIKLLDAPPFTNFWNKEITLTPHIYPGREITINGRPYVTQLITRFVLYPTTSGKLTIPPLTYSMVAYAHGPTPAPNRYFVLKTAPLTINVQPLPEKDQPAEFRGAVGSFKMKVSLKDRSTRVGIPTRLIIEVEADTNLDALTPPVLPETASVRIYDLNRVSLKNENEQAATVVRWEADVVATMAGDLMIPALTFAYFNPASQSYQVLKSEPIPLEVAAAPTVATPTVAPRNSLLTRLVNTPALRYSLLALLLAAGIGLARILQRRPTTVPVNSSELPEIKPSPLAQEVRRLVNSSYSKLSLGDERAYAADILRALRMIFEAGFAVPPSELTLERIRELLGQRGINETLSQDIIELYREHERICFSPTTESSSVETARTHYQQTRSLVLKLLESIEESLPNSSNPPAGKLVS
ncbi:MAG: BatD family protein [Acidobacteriota bacterium]